MVAVAGLGDQLGPAVIAVAGPVHDLPEDAGEQLAHPDRLGHATSPGAGIGGHDPQARCLLGQQLGRVGAAARWWPG